MTQENNNDIKTDEKEDIIPTIDFDFSDVEESSILEDDQGSAGNNDKGGDDKPKGSEDGETEEITTEDEDSSSKEGQEKSTESSDYSPQEIEAAKTAFQIYVDQGLFEKPEDEELEVTPDVVAEKLVESANQRAQAFLDQGVQRLPDWAQRLLRLSYAKGNQITPDEVEELFELVKPTTYQESDLDDAEKAKAYLEDYHSKRGYPKNTVTEIIESLEADGKLVDQAKVFLKSDETQRLKKADEKVEAAEEQRKGYLESKEKFDEGFSTALEDTNWKREKKQQIVQEFYTGQFKQKFDKILREHPNALIQLVDIFSYFKDGKFDLEAYKKEAFSPSVAKVKNNMGKYFNSSKLKADHTQKSTEDEILGFAD